MTWTEIAIDMARRLAREHGGELESFSLDGVDTYEDDGIEMIVIKASVRITPGSDEIPWDPEPLPPLPAAT